MERWWIHLKSKKMCMTFCCEILLDTWLGWVCSWDCSRAVYIVIMNSTQVGIWGSYGKLIYWLLVDISTCTTTLSYKSTYITHSGCLPFSWSWKFFILNVNGYVHWHLITLASLLNNMYLFIYLYRGPYLHHDLWELCVCHSANMWCLRDAMSVYVSYCT